MPIYYHAERKQGRKTEAVGECNLFKQAASEAKSRRGDIPGICTGVSLAPYQNGEQYGSSVEGQPGSGAGKLGD